LELTVFKGDFGRGIFLSGASLAQFTIPVLEAIIEDDDYYNLEDSDESSIENLLGDRLEGSGIFQTSEACKKLMLESSPIHNKTSQLGMEVLSFNLKGFQSVQIKKTEMFGPSVKMS
jgi:hypothetical protein